MLEPQEPLSGRYRLQHRLRRGGMSDVYLAHDELLDRDVAIKLVDDNDNDDCIQSLHREVQTMNALSHDHILPTLDYGRHGSYHYLVMPYMKQGTLRERIAKGRLTEQEAGDILAQVASAIQFAHDHGIVHRDIKPSNILLDDFNERHVYLADFGLAKVLGEGSDLTQTGCLIGTAEYMAPELVDRPESVSSDIYALGVLLYQMLTGRPPFTGSTPLAVFWKHIREQPPPPSHLNPAISRPVEQVILCALNKEPQQRFLSAKTMAQAYTNALRVSVSKHAQTTPVLQSFGPALVAPRKIDNSTLPTTVRQTTHLLHSPHSKIQKTLVTLVAAILIVTPLSLGFLLSRDNAQAPLILSTSAQFAGSTPLAPHASTATPTRRPTPVVQNVGGSTSIPQHKHKHRQGNENGNGNGNGDRNRDGNGNGNGNRNGDRNRDGNGNDDGNG